MNRRLPALSLLMGKLLTIVSAFLLTLSFPCSLTAQTTETADSISAEIPEINRLSTDKSVGSATPDSLSVPGYDLQEVVVNSEGVVRKGNLTELYPGKRDRRFAAGAIDVLSNMNISEVRVDPLTNEVTSSDGRPVKMFIDFQPATSQQLRDVRPQDIQRIDIIRNPTDPRFMGAEIAANFIMKKYEYGGYTKADVTQSVPVYNSNYGLYSKFSYRKMTYDLSTGLDYTRAGNSNGTGEVSRYLFDTGEVIRNAQTTGCKGRYLAPRATLRAIYNKPGVSVSNLFGFNFTKTRPNTRTGTVEYSSLYPTTTYEDNMQSYTRGFSWKGNVFFPLGRGWTMNVNTGIDWGSNSDWSDYRLTGADPIINDIREHIIDGVASVNAGKSFRSHNLNLWASGGWNRHKLLYRTILDTDVYQRKGYGQIRGQVSFNFDGFSISPSAKLSVQSERINDRTYTRWLPHTFIPFYLQLTRRSSLSGSFEFAMGAEPASSYSPVLVQINEVLATRGNEDLENYRYINARLGYNHYFGQWLSIRAEARHTRNDNVVVSVYSQGVAPGGTPMMVSDFINDGSTSYSTLSLSLNGKYFSDRLAVSLWGSMGYFDQRGERRRHAWYPKFNGSATYYMGNFRLSALYSPSSKSYFANSSERTPAYWALSVAYSYDDLYVDLRFSNPFSRSYMRSEESFSSPLYSSDFTYYSPTYHQSLRLTLSYSIGYGKKLDRRDEVGGIAGPESIILKK
ncbi:MAG: hypothetical protein K2J70_07290 [Muribaculaceae bacterium]|nr:hypothetical protein [Muribaculaceae bacterium]